MTITDDVLALRDIQRNLLKTENRYIQTLPTPADIPTVGSDAKIGKLSKPSDEALEIPFVPTAKDYQFAVDVWEKVDPDRSWGFVITAKRDLGNGIVETITYEG